ncbi:hypothetical protein JV46_00870 [Solemya velum gill symbiont]|uniref:Uncharacterized protein n=1 Tax=Solemya velum gill symbiont TaxID=2340 RepID=A0A0B0H956_SOVGS|nr:hypothetical protein [Solemya velum gill symbiont]KHF23981.1 hypothetical protein JV46_00870 [Solemya velum gill symbiont]
MMGETTSHVAIHARHLAIGNGTVISFAYDTLDLTLMFFPGTVVLETFPAKVDGAEKSRDGCYSVEMVIIHQV